MGKIRDLVTLQGLQAAIFYMYEQAKEFADKLEEMNAILQEEGLELMGKLEKELEEVERK